MKNDVRRNEGPIELRFKWIMYLANGHGELILVSSFALRRRLLSRQRYSSERYHFLIK